MAAKGGLGEDALLLAGVLLRHGLRVTGIIYWMSRTRCNGAAQWKGMEVRFEGATIDYFYCGDKNIIIEKGNQNKTQ